jgi:hypothetical protein
MTEIESQSNPEPESLQSGIAALQDTVDPFEDDPPYPVNGIAMPSGVVTHGGSGVERVWPAETLREAADLLVGKSIVQDFHPASAEQAPPSAIIGQITDTGFSEEEGLLFEGEITNQEAARKIDRGYFEVSVRPAIAQERYDADADAHIVEAIADFLDIALVDWGAAHGNAISVGSNPSIAALSQHLLENTRLSTDALQETAVSEPNWEGYSTAEWSAPSLQGTFNGDLDAARNSATFIRDGGESFGDLSLFVVDGERQLNLNALDSAWQLATQTDDVSDDEASRLRSLYESIAETARDAGEISDSEWEDSWQPRIGGDSDTDANARTYTNASTTVMTAPSDALQEDSEGQTRLDVWAEFLAGLSGSVDTDGANFGALHTLIAAEVENVGPPDVAEVIPPELFEDSLSMDDARDAIASLVSDDDEGDSDEDIEEGDEENEESESNSDDTEANADESTWRYEPTSTIGALFMRELELTGTTPDRCKTIKDGAKTFDPDSDAIARDILGLKDEDQTDLTDVSFNTGDPVDSEAADRLVSPDADEEDPKTVKRRREDEPQDGNLATAGIGEDDDPVGSQALGRPDPREETDEEPAPSVKRGNRNLSETESGEDSIVSEMMQRGDPRDETDEEPMQTIKRDPDDPDSDYSEATIDEDDSLGRQALDLPDPVEEPDEEPDPSVKDNTEQDLTDASTLVGGDQVAQDFVGVEDSDIDEDDESNTAEADD